MLLEKILGRTMFVARTDGMRPRIFAGDVVVVRVSRHGRHRYAIGDIVAFRDGPDSRLAVRRISDVIERGNRGVSYLAHEDGVTGSSLSPEQIVGRVEARLANVGRVLHDARACRSRFSLSGTAPAPNARRDSFRKNAE